MGAFHSLQDVEQLARCLDDQFLGILFDRVMEPGKRRALDKGRGTRAQTFKRYACFYLLREVFECEEVHVAKVSGKDRSVVRDGVQAFKDLMVSENFGFGVCEISDMAYQMIEWQKAIYAQHDVPPDKALKGWSASVAAWAFYLAARSAYLNAPKSKRDEYLEGHELADVRVVEQENKARASTQKSYKQIAESNSKKSAAAALETQALIRKVAPAQPAPPPSRSKLKISHPAIALLNAARDQWKELRPMVCADTAEPGDYFTLAHVEPDIATGKGERIRITTKADKADLITALPKIVRTLNEGGVKAISKYPPEARAKGGSYVLIAIR